MLVFRKSIYTDILFTKKIITELFFKKSLNDEEITHIGKIATDFDKGKPVPVHDVLLNGELHAGLKRVNPPDAVLPSQLDHTNSERTSSEPALAVKNIIHDGHQITSPVKGPTSDEDAIGESASQRIRKTGAFLRSRFAPRMKNLVRLFRGLGIATGPGQPNDDDKNLDKRLVQHAGGSIPVTANLPVTSIEVALMNDKDLAGMSIDPNVMQQAGVQLEALLPAIIGESSVAHLLIGRAKTALIRKIMFRQSHDPKTKERLRNLLGWDPGSIGYKKWASFFPAHLLKKMFQPIEALGVPLMHGVQTEKGFLGIGAPKRVDEAVFSPDHIRDILAEAYHSETFGRMTRAMSDDNKTMIEKYLPFFEKDEDDKWVKQNLPTDHVVEILNALQTVSAYNSQYRTVHDQWEKNRKLFGAAKSQMFNDGRKNETAENGRFIVALPFGDRFGWPNPRKDVESWQKGVKAHLEGNLKPALSALFTKWMTGLGVRTQQPDAAWIGKSAEKEWQGMTVEERRKAIQIFGGANYPGAFPGFEEGSGQKWAWLGVYPRAAGFPGGVWQGDQHARSLSLTDDPERQTDLEKIKELCLIQIMHAVNPIISPRVNHYDSINMGTYDTRNLHFQLSASPESVSTMFTHVRFNSDYTLMDVLTYKRNIKTGKFYFSPDDDFERYIIGWNESDKSAFRNLNREQQVKQMSKRGIIIATPLSQVRYRVPTEKTNPPFTLDSMEPSDRDYTEACKALLNTDPPDRVKHLETMAAWDRYNDDFSKYVILSRLNQTLKAGEQKINLEKQLEEIKKKYDNPNAGRMLPHDEFTEANFYSVNSINFPMYLAKTRMQFNNPMDTTTETRQDRMKKEIDDATTNPQGKQQEFFDALSAYAHTISSETMAWHAALEHYVIAVALRNSNTPKVIDNVRVGELGPLNNPSYTIASGAEVYTNPIVIPRGVHPAIGLQQLIDQKHPLIKIDPVPDSPLEPSTFLDKEHLPLSVQKASSDVNGKNELDSALSPNQHSVRVVTDDERREYRREPGLAKGWTFPLSLQEDREASLAFFGHRKGPIERIDDMRDAIEQELLLAIKSGLVIAKSADPKDRVILTATSPSDVPTVTIHKDRKFIRISGLRFSGTENTAATINTGNSKDIDLEIKEAKDEKGKRTSFYVDMTPLRIEAQIISHVLETGKMLSGQNADNLREIQEEARMQREIKLGTRFNQVPSLHLKPRQSEISEVEAIARHGAVHRQLDGPEAMDKIEAKTGFKILRDISDAFTINKKEIAYGRVVAINGNTAIVMMPVQIASDLLDSVPHVNSGLEEATIDANRISEKKDREYSQTFFGKMFARLFPQTQKEKFPKIDMGTVTSPNGDTIDWNDEFGKVWKSFQTVFGNAAPSTSYDGRPGSYEDKRNRDAKNQQNPIERPMQYFVVDLHNARVVNNDTGADPVKLGSFVEISPEKPDHDSLMIPTVMIEQKPETQMAEFWEIMSLIDNAEKEIYGQEERSNKQIGFSLDKHEEDLIRMKNAGGDHAESARSLLDYKDRLMEIRKGSYYSEAIGTEYDHDAEARSQLLAYQNLKYSKNQKATRKNPKNVAVYTISAYDVMATSIPTRAMTSHTQAITDIFRILSVMHEGSQDQLMLKQTGVIDERAKTLPSFSILQKVAEYVNNNPAGADGAGRFGTNNDALFEGSPQQADFIQQHVFVIPEHSSLYNATALPSPGPMSPQDMRKSIGNFTTDLIEKLKKYGINIVIHSGNKESINLLDPSAPKAVVGPKETTWTAKDGTIFWGSGSKNPVQSLYWEIIGRAVEHGMQNPQAKTQALKSLAAAVARGGDEPLIKKLIHIHHTKQDDDDATRRVLRLFWMTDQAEETSKVNWINSGWQKGYPEELNDVMEPDPSLQARQDYDLIGYQDNEKISPRLRADLAETVAAANIANSKGITRAQFAKEYFGGRLNSEQLKATSPNPDGPTNIVGIAGSGKTTTLVSSALALVSLHGILQPNILIMTFSRAASDRFRQAYQRQKDEYVEALQTNGLDRDNLKNSLEYSPDTGYGDLESPKAEPFIATTHKLALYLIYRNLVNVPGVNTDPKTGNRIKFDPTTSVVDAQKQRTIIEDLINQLTSDVAGQIGKESEGKGIINTATYVTGVIQKAKDTEDMREIGANPALQKIWHKYNEYLADHKLLDFSDLITKTVRALESSPETRARMRDKFQAIMVDEFQDINPLQMRLIRALAPANGANVTVVGDQKQSIYGFRGANPEYATKTSLTDWFGLNRTGNTAKQINLQENYRARPSLASIATLLDDRDWFAARARNIFDRGKITIFQAPAKDNNTAADEQQKQIRKLLLEKYGEDDGGTIRIPWKDNIPPVAIICRTNEEAKELRRTLENNKIDVAPQRAGEEKTFYEQMQEVMQDEPDDKDEEIFSGVKIMTAHASKGSEFDTVILYNVVDSNWPHTRIFQEQTEEDFQEAYEQEKNLFYVSVTRAENELHILTKKAEQGMSPMVKDLIDKTLRRRSLIDMNRSKLIS